MSGGSFEYAYHHVAEFAAQLEDYLDSDEGVFKPDVKDTLHGIVLIALRASRLMREVEWLYSGDTGEDTFMQRVKEID